MKETERLISLFQKHYDGEPWLDVALMANLRRIPADKAARRILPNCNTIWEITNHLIAWRENVLLRLTGELVPTPAHNYFQPVHETSEEAWKTTLSKMEASQKKWVGFLQGFKEEQFDTLYPGNNHSYYDHIQGILQHDMYHLGQIMLLAKAGDL